MGNRHLTAHSGARGFTLLELVVAVTMLASFILPMLYLVSDAQVRATRYTLARQVRGLAQATLYDRMYDHPESDFEGTYEAEGHPDWVWSIDEPQVRTQGEQAILTYTIRVELPQRLEKNQPSGEGSVYEYTMWTFPTENFMENEAALFDSGQYSVLYGDPQLGGTGASSGTGMGTGTRTGTGIGR